MKALRIIGIVVGALVAVVIALNAFSDGKVSVSHAVVINRPAAQLLPLVSDFARYNEWQPWKQKDSAAAYVLSTPSSGVGAKMSWTGKEVGVGSNVITSVTPNEVQYAVTFVEPFQNQMKDFIKLEADGNGTKVTWYNEAEAMPFPFRWMAGFFQADVQKDYETGLDNLKRLAESQPVAADTSAAAPAK